MNKDLLELARKMIKYIGEAKFEKTGSELFVMVTEMQRFSNLIVHEEKLNEGIKASPVIPIIKKERKRKERKDGVQEEKQGQEK